MLFCTARLPSITIFPVRIGVPALRKSEKGAAEGEGPTPVAQQPSTPYMCMALSGKPHTLTPKDTTHQRTRCTAQDLGLPEMGFDLSLLLCCCSPLIPCLPCGATQSLYKVLLSVALERPSRQVQETGLGSSLVAFPPISPLNVFWSDEGDLDWTGQVPASPSPMIICAIAI